MDPGEGGYLYFDVLGTWRFFNVLFANLGRRGKYTPTLSPIDATDAIHSFLSERKHDLAFQNGLN